MEHLVIRHDYGRSFDDCLEMGNADEVLDLFIARCDASSTLNGLVDPFYLDLERIRAQRAALRSDSTPQLALIA
ncbi:MAG: hypothetical protein ACR2M1_05295 [Gemmatimonadaceae bacterium]